MTATRPNWKRRHTNRQSSPLANATHTVRSVEPGWMISTPMPSHSFAACPVLPMSPVRGRRASHWRIIHLCDLHIVPPEALGMERGSAVYRRHLAQPEMVHHQHLAVLRCLARHHGLQTVHAEGLNDDGLQAWRERVALLKGMLADEPTLLAARKLGKLEADATELLEQVRSERLEAGAVGVLEALGEGRALPLETRQGGELAQRDRAIVKRLLAAGPLAVVVLGGGHELAGEVARQGRNAEYLRVEVTQYPLP
jgi:hypothetical protein